MSYLVLKLVHVAGVVLFLGNITRRRSLEELCRSNRQRSRAQRRISFAAHAGNCQEYEELSKRWTFWGSIALVLPVVAF